jgi:hypothetical protein
MEAAVATASRRVTEWAAGVLALLLNPKVRVARWLVPLGASCMSASPL